MGRTYNDEHRITHRCGGPLSSNPDFLYRVADLLRFPQRAERSLSIAGHVHYSDGMVNIHKRDYRYRAHGLDHPLCC